MQDKENTNRMAPRIDEIVAHLMQGTFFADEEEQHRLNGNPSGALRLQMSKELKTKLESGQPLRVYLGVDPTSADLHVGHFVPLKKLKRFQDQGHHVIFLIGDYTAMIGDPSGRETGREKLTHQQVLQNARTYTDQAFKILDKHKTEVRYNSEWLAKLTFADIIELASIFPLKQIISRRDFQARMDKGESLRFHESLYSLMQGYDAYALRCDVQVGAYDQYFNMLAGREIQAHYGQKPHVMITNPLLSGTDGRKMSKSFGNTINILEDPFDMYGKTMRIADGYIEEYLILTSTLPDKQINELITALKEGMNPMNVKKELAFNLVELYHGTKAATEAAEKFQTMVQKKSAPADVPIVEVPRSYLGDTWVNLLYGLSLLNTKGEARRLIKQKGFYVNQQKMDDPQGTVSISEEALIRIGKRRYYRLITTK